MRPAASAAQAPETVRFFLDEKEKMKLWITELKEIIYPEGLDRNNPSGTKFKQKLKEKGLSA